MNKRTKKLKSPNRSQIAGTSKQTCQDNYCDKISMSRKLKTKKQDIGRIKRTPIKRTMNKRLHTQNKPMPTFKDLEKMFEDPKSMYTTAPEVTDNMNTSHVTLEDSNNIIEQNVTVNMNNRKDDVVTGSTSNLHPSDCSIVEIPNQTNCDDSIQTISLIEPLIQKVIDCNEIITIDDDEPEIIVQERKRKLDLTDGIIKSKNLDGEMRQKQRKFENFDVPKDDNGSDSDVTVVYDLDVSPVVSPISSASPYKRFSPLPSTSTDSETILKNDKIFMECLSANTSSIEAEASVKTQSKELPILIADDGDFPVTVESSTRIKSPQTISIDDEVVITSSNVVDVIDVDEIIACNRIILSKYRTSDNLPAVIEVAPVGIANITHSVSDAIEIGNSPSTRRRNTNEQVLPTTTATDSLSTSTSQNSTNAAISNIISLRNNFTPQSMITRSSTIANELHNIISSTNRSLSTSNTPISPNVNIPHHTSPQSNNFTPNCTSNSSQNPDVSTGLNCPICLDNLRATECASTLCGHIFCMDCIKRALRNSRKCPTCRKTIKGNHGYHRLFL